MFFLVGAPRRCLLLEGEVGPSLQSLLKEGGQLPESFGFVSRWYALRSHQEVFEDGLEEVSRRHESVQDQVLLAVEQDFISTVEGV